MRSVHGYKGRDMLGAAGAAEAVSGGSGRLELGRLASLRGRLPVAIQRRAPTDALSALLFLSYAWFVISGVVSAVQATGQPQAFGLVLLSLLYVAFAAAGLWFGANLVVVAPNVFLWVLLVGANLASGRPAYLPLAVDGACIVMAVWAGARAAIGSRREVVRSTGASESAINQLGWGLYQLSAQIPPTDEGLPGVRVYSSLRIGELQRHFDQVTSAAISGGMQHAFRLQGWTGTVYGLPGLVDSAAHTSLGGGGSSTVDLGLAGTTRDELTGEAFMAVFERASSEGLDTIRAVVPSERQVRLYVDQMLNSWLAGLASAPTAEAMVKRYAVAISRAVASDSSYVGDRLNALLRLPSDKRPAVTVIGQELDHHAILVGSIRFGASGPLYQLFPIALVRALEALIQGRQVPPGPPSDLPPADGTIDSDGEKQSSEPALVSAAAGNGHIASLQIRTLGGLRLTVGEQDLTSSLLDRKVLAFLWLHLLARTLRNPGESITRASLADELSPGLDSSTQRSRLRGRLSELRKELPPSIGRRVMVEGERLSLDLHDCNVDVLQIAAAARTFGGSNGVLTPDQLVQLESLGRLADGKFLPEWDDIEQHVNKGRSGAGEVVADLRVRLEAASASLLRTLGAAYVAHGNPEAAIGPLERALAIVPDDEAAARSLAAACAQTGRLARAEELRKEYSLV